MPIINIERILSVSSEDPAHPAENLLKADTSKKWKCKVGEKQASAILQLKQGTVIDGIDIGNENSAFVEVLVGKSSSPNDDFKVLLVASSLMTMRESKDGTNTSGVRFFKKENLTQPTAGEKWDRVKVVCTQPFNKHVQYGLSFIVLHSSSADVGSSTSLGRFTLKDNDSEEPVTVGSWFAKRKDPPPPVPPGAAAAIRDASSPAGIAQGKNKKPTSKRPRDSIPKNGVLKPSKDGSSKKTPKAQAGPLIVVRKRSPPHNFSPGDEDDSPADDTDADSTYSPNKDKASVLSDDDVALSGSDDESPRKKGKRPKRDTKNGRVPNNQNTKRKNNDPAAGGSKAKVANTNTETKPFNRLMEGVTFVISGYQNPLRGELRSKACAMGARYKPDWENSCTHLICAFVNTPKFNQVRGKGKIVKKEWVEECHSRRRRLPWRRFALDRRDAGTSSEEEIWEEGLIPTTSSTTTTAADLIASGVNRRRVSSGSDTEEEIERVRARQAANKPATPNINKPATQKTNEDQKKPSVKTTDNRVDPFDEDTDVDSDTENPTANLPLPPLPDFFANIVFHIAADITDEERKRLRRYIIAYKGSVMDDMDSTVEYVLTKLTDVAAEVGEEFGVSSVSPEWVWECSDAGKLVPVTQFTL